MNPRKVEGANRALKKETKQLINENNQLNIQNQNLILRDQHVRRIIDLAERNADIYLNKY